MAKFYIDRYGSNAANQSMDNGPCRVATVEAENADDACRLALRRVTVYCNQYLDARLASEVDAEEAEVDRRVRVE